ncbi:hypothetical protein TCAL_09488 [Tigriopus californicus]|uniref:Sulfotransferase domain-containing protein n=1 Tax=Tigriopus californicus TaxID=6832 RepID=A0A553PLQ6_TIGCA|nr:uncharacterized protein LOC131890860 [Tigriopus californicus]TRY78614.1 hypothetical protein TCAL_09488 [Tigriopus californicus]
MHCVVIFVSLIDICVSLSVQSHINEWCSKFLTLQSFSSCEPKPDFPCNKIFGRTIVPGLNISDFQPYGKSVDGHWQQIVNPDINPLACFKGTCSKNIRFIVGAFDSKGLQKPVEVTFHDGSKILANFIDSIVHGLSVEFDPSGHQTRIGFYHNGQESFPFWHFSPSTNSAVLYWNPEKALYLVNDECFAVNLISNRILSGHRCLASEFVTENEFLLPKTVDLNSSLIPEFQAPDYLTSVSDFVMAQSTWLSLMSHPSIHGQSIFQDPSKSVLDIVDPVAIPKTFDDGTTTKCNAIVTAHLLLPGSLHETPMVCALGSGSKWIGNLLEWSTGIQGYVDAVAVLSPRYKRGAGLFVKTHHQVLQHVSEARKRESLSWRMRHIQNYHGRGILLIRSPYKTILSHWKHRHAGDEVSSMNDVELVAGLRTKEFHEFAKMELKIWMDIALDWLAVVPELFVIHYENFLEDKMKEIRKVLDFFNLPHDRARLKCVASHQSSKFKRQHQNQIPKDVFTTELLSLFDDAIEKVNKFILSRDLEPLPVSKYDFTNLI